MYNENMSKNFRQFFGSVFLYTVALLMIAVFSFSFTDPNLVLSSNPVYWQAQQWFWRTWFDNPVLQAQWFAGLMVVIWLSYAFFARSLWGVREKITGKMLVIVVALFLLPLLFAYNALSHDIFNYMFNAKMVVEFGADPHVKTALDFAYDPWTRFMHNTHTPAPYGYGWTAISVVPFTLGMGKFLPSFLLFKMWSVLGMLVTAGGIVWWLRKTGQTERVWLVLLVFANPLLLFELTMSGHNDGWMLAPAVWMLALLQTKTPKMIWVRVMVAILLLLFSASIKFATVVLIPIALWCIVGERWQRRLTPALLAFAASALLFLPLMTSRSQYFHPWYLSWSLVWLPMVKMRVWWLWLMALSVSATFRYLPWIHAGGFEGNVLFQQQLVTWVGGVVVFGVLWIIFTYFIKKSEA